MTIRATLFLLMVAAHATGRASIGADGFASVPAHLVAGLGQMPGSESAAQVVGCTSVERDGVFAVDPRGDVPALLVEGMGPPLGLVSAARAVGFGADGSAAVPAHRLGQIPGLVSAAQGVGCTSVERDGVFAVNPRGDVPAHLVEGTGPPLGLVSAARAVGSGADGSAAVPAHRLGQIPAPAVRATGCTAVEGDRIFGADLARADARFAAVPPDLVVGLAPLPGVRRSMDVRELVRIAQAHGIDWNGLPALCFERRSEVLTEARVRQTLEPLLPQGATFDILEFSRNTLPAGELKFALRDLGRPPAGDPKAAVLWRGRILYGSNSSVTVWAKVRVLAKEAWVETARAIPAGRRIEAEDLTTREELRFPFATPPLRDPAGAIGKSVSRTLAAGQILSPGLLVSAHDVRSGEPVNVVVASGGVRLRFGARALSSGRVDDLVLIALDSGKKLKATVLEKGKVTIHAGN